MHGSCSLVCETRSTKGVKEDIHFQSQPYNSHSIAQCGDQTGNIAQMSYDLLQQLSQRVLSLLASMRCLPVTWRHASTPIGVSLGHFQTANARALMPVESSNSYMIVTDFLWLDKQTLKYGVQPAGAKRSILEARSS